MTGSVYKLQELSYCRRKDGLPGVESVSIVSAVHHGFQGRCRGSKVKCFPPRNEKEREGGISHLREERRLSFSRRLMTVRQFSSTADVTQTYASLSPLSTVSSSSSAFFSFPFYFPSLLSLSCLLFF